LASRLGVHVEKRQIGGREKGPTANQLRPLGRAVKWFKRRGQGSFVFGRVSPGDAKTKKEVCPQKQGWREWRGTKKNGSPETVEGKGVPDGGRFLGFANRSEKVKSARDCRQGFLLGGGHGRGRGDPEIGGALGSCRCRERVVELHSILSSSSPAKESFLSRRGRVVLPRSFAVKRAKRAPGRARLRASRQKRHQE